MLLSDFVTEIGNEIDRSDLDTKIKRWVQNATNFIYSVLPFASTERTATSSTVASTETLSVPGDFGEMVKLTYTPGDGSGYELTERTPTQYFESFPDQNTTGFPKIYCIYDNQIFMYPKPSSAYSMTMRYRIASPNIYTHNLKVTYDLAADVNGVALYLDEDAFGTGYGKLYFVSPTTNNAKLRMASADGHVHEVIVYHSATAATLGTEVYLEEDTTTLTDVLQFASATTIDCLVWTDNTRKHKHFIKFIDKLNPGTGAKQLYIDEDVVDKTARLVCDVVADADFNVEAVLGPDNVLPPFFEQYQELVYLEALSQAQRFNKQYDDARFTKTDLMRNKLPFIASRENRRLSAVTEAKPFGGGVLQHQPKWVANA